MSWFPTTANDALSIEPGPSTSEYVNVSPTSGSVVESAPTTAPTDTFSAMMALDTAMSAGARLAVTDVPRGTVAALITVAAP